jgi:hypothetical protein
MKESDDDHRVAAPRRTGCFDGKKMLVASKQKFAILDIKPAQKFDKPMATADMEVPVGRSATSTCRPPAWTRRTS